ncbi:uncharacterized protein AB675_10124 [Cyphellophora attinorum]|uniref:DUF1993 domain-containing protein n=1 Tax=Cyphellophora attinorum TaxID=1664694 RepID=A0A0N1NXL8_9EURO|nr:uncharacterized protein AB675_10124 [Phialophora attinorum]KPI35157.1 hypothetical protein AB675_10124 [Phialophora attinorum]
MVAYEGSFYDATVGMSLGALHALQNFLLEASDHTDPTSLLTARLAPDMWPLSFQYRYACNVAEYISRLLSGHNIKDEPIPATPTDTSITWDAIGARVAQVIKRLDAVDRDEAGRLGDQVVVEPWRGTELPLKALVGNASMPNVYFHTAMAYAILRANGVKVMKRHWARAFARNFLPSGASARTVEDKPGVPTAGHKDLGQG